MKKFLSLLLALVMTMSLVTISAGATEYKDLTDKDELGPQYQEAVAVLNKIGVITGYDDGSFRPDVELTRGAAAKIIVSLLIGPEAASNLPNNSAPYPDVPANHTFAGVISFCKTAGIINGYGDGTFKPANDLTGYAFAKMLLSALGYDNTIEGFVDSGWTMNVLNIGQEASLFDRLDFKGSEAVTRKDAALLALNTLKATVVEYNNPQTITISGADAVVNVTGGQTRSYKLSNQDYARNILSVRRDIANENTSRADYNTVEFAEEHFVDLRLPHDKYDPTPDDYGRPSAEWSYKKLSIGKFPLVPDFEYTSQVAHDVETVTAAAKVRALELTGYKITRSAAEAATVGSSQTQTNLWINGYEVPKDSTAYKETLTELGDIANLTDNGTLVDLYVDNNGADFITDIVVIKSQLMEVKRLGADYVTLEACEPDGESSHAITNIDKETPIYGFNQEPVELKINNVELGDDYYEFLSGLKTGDRVVVEPVSVDHGSTDWNVGHAYVPETVKGTLNGVPDRFGTVGVKNGYSALSVDVGGTTYKVSLWNQDLYEITPDAIKVTKRDVTLILDRYGYAMLAEDVGSISGWMIVRNYRQSIENGILVTYANGWDLDGEEVSLNIGARAGVTNWSGSSASDDVWDQKGLPRIGSLVKYSSSTTSNTADWDLSQANEDGVYNIYQGKDQTGDDYYLRANASTVTVTNAASRNTLGTEHYAFTNDANLKELSATQTVLMGSSMKYIYVSFDESGELDSIEITSNRTKVESTELKASKSASNSNGHLDAQAAVEVRRDDATGINELVGVKAVVIKRENSDASYRNLLYVISNDASAMRDANGQMVQGYEVAMMDENGKVTITTVYAYRTNLVPGNFARYTKSTHDDHPDDFYTLRAYDGEPGRSAATLAASLYGYKGGNNNLWTLYNVSGRTTDARSASNFNVGNTQPDDRNVFVKDDSDSWDSFADWMVNLRGAAWVDLTKNGIDSVDDLKDVFDGGKNLVDVTLLFNDDTGSDYFRSVYLIIVTKVTEGKGPAIGGSTGTTSNTADGTTYAGSYVINPRSGAVTWTVTFTRPAWVPSTATVAEFSGTITVDGIPFTINKSSLTGDANGNRVSFTYYVPNYAAADDSTVSFNISSVRWSDVNVELANPIGAATLVTTTVPTDGTASTITVQNPGTGYDTFDVQVKQGDVVLADQKDVGGQTGQLSIALTTKPNNSRGPVQVVFSNGESFVEKVDAKTGLTQERVTNAITGSTADKLTAVKALGTGVYVLEGLVNDATNADSPFAQACDPRDTRTFVFDKDGDGTYTLKIGNNGEYYTETFTTTYGLKGPSLFNVQVTKLYNNDVFHNTDNPDATGSMAGNGTPLSSGTYNWSISSGTQLLASGTFVVNGINSNLPVMTESQIGSVIVEDPSEDGEEASADEWGNAARNELLKQPDGVYKFPVDGDKVKDGNLSIGTTDEKDVYCFVGRTSKAQTVTFYLWDENSGNPVLKIQESMRVSAPGSFFLYYQLTGDSVWNSDDLGLNESLNGKTVYWKIVGEDGSTLGEDRMVVPNGTTSGS